MSNIITIDATQLGEFAEQGGKLVIQRDAEISLLKLLQLKDMVEAAIATVKKEIAQAGVAVDPNFRGCNGQSVKATYGYFGGQFKAVDREKAKPFMKQVVTERLDTEKVKEYVKKNMEVPDGIVENEKSLSFRVADDAFNSLPEGR